MGNWGLEYLTNRLRILNVKCLFFFFLQCAQNLILHLTTLRVYSKPLLNVKEHYFYIYKLDVRTELPGKKSVSGQFLFPSDVRLFTVHIDIILHLAFKKLEIRKVFLIIMLPMSWSEPISCMFLFQIR